MINKLFTIVILLALSAFFAILANGYEIIECNNSNKTCTTISINTLLNTQNTSSPIDVRYSPTYGGNSARLGINGKSISYNNSDATNLICKEKPSSNGEEHKTFVLTPVSDRQYHSYGKDLNTYGSQAMCEMDRGTIQSYLNSKKKTKLSHRVIASYFNFLWYIGTLICLLLAFFALISKNVDNREPVVIDEKQKEAMKKFEDGVTDFANAFSNIDNNASNVIRKVNSFGNININHSEKDDK